MGTLKCISLKNCDFTFNMFLFCNTQNLYFLRKSSLCIGSFPRKVVFGITNESEFDTEKSFVIDLSIITNLYKVLTNILLKLKNTKEPSELLEFATENHKTYFWRVTDSEKVDLIIKIGDVTSFQICLDYIQFNELLYAISESILPILCLKTCDIDFFEFILHREIPIRELIVMVDNVDKFESMINNTSFALQKYRYYTLFKLNFDVIFILNKLKKFVVHDFLPNNAKHLLTALHV